MWKFNAHKKKERLWISIQNGNKYCYELETVRYGWLMNLDIYCKARQWFNFAEIQYTNFASYTYRVKYIGLYTHEGQLRHENENGLTYKKEQIKTECEVFKDCWFASYLLAVAIAVCTQHRHCHFTHTIIRVYWSTLSVEYQLSIVFIAFLNVFYLLALCSVFFFFKIKRN